MCTKILIEIKACKKKIVILGSLVSFNNFSLSVCPVNTCAIKEKKTVGQVSLNPHPINRQNPTLRQIFQTSYLEFCMVVREFFVGVGVIVMSTNFQACSSK